MTADWRALRSEAWPSPVGCAGSTHRAWPSRLGRSVNRGAFAGALGERGERVRAAVGAGGRYGADFAEAEGAGGSGREGPSRRALSSRRALCAQGDGDTGSTVRSGVWALRVIARLSRSLRDLRWGRVHRKGRGSAGSAPWARPSRLLGRPSLLAAGGPARETASGVGEGGSPRRPAQGDAATENPLCAAPRRSRLSCGAPAHSAPGGRDASASGRRSAGTSGRRAST